MGWNELVNKTEALINKEKEDEAFNLVFEYSGNNKEKTWDNLSNLGRHFLGKKNHNISYKLFNLALELAKEFEPKGNYPEYLEVLNKMRELAERYTHDNRYFNKAKELYFKISEIHKNLEPKGRHPEYIKTLNEMKKFANKTINLTIKIEIYFKLFDIYKEFKPEGQHPEYIKTLNDMRDDLPRRNWRTKEELEKLLNIYKNLEPQGKHPEYIKTLNKLRDLCDSYLPKEKNYSEKVGNLEKKLKEYSRFNRFNRRLNQETMLVEGEDYIHPDYYETSYELLKLKLIMKYSLEAKEELEKLLDIYKNLEPQGKHPEYAKTLYYLGNFYLIKEDYVKSKKLYEKATDIYKDFKSKNIRPEYKDILNKLQSLGNLFFDRNEVNKATELHEKLLSMYRELEPKNRHWKYTKSFNQLCSFYLDTGNYNKTKELCETSMRQLIEAEAQQNNDDLDSEYSDKEYKQIYEIILGNLLKVSIKVFGGGDYEQYFALSNDMIDLYIKYKQIIDSASKTNYGDTLISSVAMFLNIKDYVKAEKLYKKMLGIYKDLEPKGKHPSYVNIINNLCMLYQITGDYVKSKDLYNELLDIYKEYEPKGKHPKYIQTLDILANLYNMYGNKTKAIDTYNELLDIYKDFEPKGKHPEYIKILNSIKTLYIDKGNYEKAIEIIIEEAHIENSSLYTQSKYNTTEEIKNYIKSIRKTTDLLLTIISQYPKSLKKYITKIFNIILKRKAFIQEIEYLRKDHILKIEDEDIKNKYKEYKNAKNELSLLYSSGYNQDFNEKYMSLDNKIKDLEAELINYIPKLSLENHFNNIKNKMIKDKLPENTTLIEYVWFVPYNFTEKDFETDSAKYLAFTLNKDSEELQMIELGYATDINNLIKRYKYLLEKDMADYSQTKGLKKKSDIDKKRMGILTNEAAELGKTLYNKLVKPLFDAISPHNKLLISTDGDISLLPFQILIQDNNRYLIEDYSISNIDSARDLIRFDLRKDKKADYKGTIIFNPNFNYKSDNNIIEEQSNQRLQKGSIRLEKVENFPESAKNEGERIEQLLKISDKKTWNDVLDKDIKRIKSPYFLHISTHGIYPKEDLTSSESPNKSHKLPMKINTLLYSGLTLTGWNTYVETKKEMTDAEDGLITSLDIMDMDLSGTNLVVLSACNTGSGQIVNGEGVYGLRRSFTVAGANSVLISLWDIYINETQDFILKYYRNLIENKVNDKVTVLRECQLDLLNHYRNSISNSNPTLINPNLWGGAFVYVGEPQGKINFANFVEN